VADPINFNNIPQPTAILRLQKELPWIDIHLHPPLVYSAFLFRFYGHSDSRNVAVTTRLSSLEISALDWLA
jgi:hypothetical protein